jgi:hypothetical protein
MAKTVNPNLSVRVRGRELKTELTLLAQCALPYQAMVCDGTLVQK